MDKEDSPGCDPVSMTWDDVLAHKGGKISYWDGDTQTAWVVRDTSGVRERMAARFSSHMGRIAEQRGAPIECVRDAHIVECEQDDDDAGWRDAYRVGLGEGWAMGLREGYLDVLRRIASRKFAVEFVSRLFRGLDQVEDVEVLAEVAVLIVDCNDADELERSLRRFFGER